MRAKTSMRVVSGWNVATGMFRLKSCCLKLVLIRLENDRHLNMFQERLTNVLEGI